MKGCRQSLLLPGPNLTPVRGQLSAGEQPAMEAVLAPCQGLWIPRSGFVQEKGVKSHITNTVFNKRLFFLFNLNLHTDNPLGL